MLEFDISDEIFLNENLSMNIELEVKKTEMTPWGKLKYLFKSSVRRKSCRFMFDHAV